MAIVYAVLWIALPPARTAAEKLELEGRPVTLAAIKERSEEEGVSGRPTAELVQRVLLFCLGLFFAVAAAVTLIATVVIGGSLVFGIGTSDSSPYADILLDRTWQYMIAFALFILSGLLLTALNVVLAVAAFRKKWTKRIGASVAAIVVAGVVVFSTGIGTFTYSVWQARESARRSMVTDVNQLPKDFAKTRSLTIDVTRVPSVGTPTVVYVVSAGAPRYELSYPAKSKPSFAVTQDGASAKATVDLPDRTPWYTYEEPLVYVYGPALDSLAVKGGAVKYDTKQRQDTVTFTATDGGTIVAAGVYGTVTATTQENARVYLDDATVGALNATTDGGIVKAGVVRRLIAAQPDTCPSPTGLNDNLITVEAIKASSNTTAKRKR